MMAKRQTVAQTAGNGIFAQPRQMSRQSIGAIRRNSAEGSPQQNV
jgi:hypothetical protein